MKTLSLIFLEPVSPQRRQDAKKTCLISLGSSLPLTFAPLRLCGKEVLIWLLAFLGSLAPAWGQTSLTSGADFLLMTTGARPDGMGQAFSAVADDINTLTFNPAGLANIRLPEVGYGHEAFLADIGYDFVGAAIPTGEAGVLGLGYLGMGTAPFNSTSNPSAPPVSVQDTALIGAWGKSFYQLHLGAAVKYIHETLAGVQGSGFAFDAGARYRLLPQLTVAGSVLNMGPGIQFASLEPLPLEVNGGLAWTVLQNPTHSLTLAMEASSVVTEDTQRYSFGAEYWYQNKFAIRAGYLANSQVEGFSAGAGVRFSVFQIDYAFEPYNTLGSVQRLSGLIQWDGPWVSGGEPNAPRYVTVRQTFEALEIRWDRAQGSIQSYEVLIQPLDGGDLIVSQPLSNPAYDFKNYSPDTLYRISVRSIGTGGGRSFPSQEVLVRTPSKEAALKMLYQEQGGKAAKESVSKGLFGRIDPVGLQLSWVSSREGGVIGYNLYRQSPSGQVEKVSQAPKQANKVWVTGASGFWGWEWIVTAVHKDGRENTLGSYLWYPTPRELEGLSKTSPRHLRAVPQPKRQVFLVWDGDPDAAGYILLYSLKADGVYEAYKEIKKTDTNALLEIPGSQDVYYFMVVPVKPNGEWSLSTQEAKVQLYQDVPAA
jgi:hypothetical protein